MVAAVYLVERTDQGKNDDRNRVRSVIVHEDDVQTDAQIIAAVTASLNRASPTGDGASDVYPDGYFDTVTKIGAAPAGPLVTDGHLIAFPSEVLRVESA